ANTIAEEYMQMNLDHRVENVNKLMKWVNGEVDKQGQLLADAEAALARYRETNNAMSLARQDLVGQRLTNMTAQVSQAQASRQQKQILYDQLKNADPADDSIDAFPAVGSNSAVVDAKGAMRTAQARVQELERQGFGDAYRPYSAAKTEVANARDKLIAAR